jgi:phosphodiesterase/alkaline phosphatase D-like protein
MAGRFLSQVRLGPVAVELDFVDPALAGRSLLSQRRVRRLDEAGKTAPPSRLSKIAEQKIENVVVIGGDIHSFWVADLKQDFGDPLPAGEPAHQILREP